ncbi:DNA-cytosine methyltransferase [Pseudomonas syringae pv. pisi]|uniref:DNA cytosine methyltransferase n=1 Tax=Pseudomonas syringae TaxID=317 RepID=UPI000EFDD173|nr:DNA cytosine methyltransferase [Pseudomonas syringae]RML58877.1 DNA-cytosine methyltransferase [Pseudomonas syringae pv. pisi]
MSAHQQYPPLQYGSVCSGIEAATAAWHPLGMEPVWFAEIEPFPSAVLAHHYPRTPNLGDMTKLGALVLAGKIKAPNVLVGGTPCQAFSVAGMRQGMLDPRGALTIKYVELADAVDHVRTSRNQPESIIVWENVPGVLSDKGNAFGCFLGALAGEDCELQPPGKRWQDAGCVYGPKRTIAWRILDAQYFGLAQRRRRVFLVASARADFDPTAVLFEREGVRRDTAPRRGEGQDVTGTAPFGPALQCGCGHVFSEELGHYGCPNCEGDEGPAVSMFGGRPDGAACGHFHAVAGTLQANGKAAGSATQQDAESGLLVVHGTQDPSYSDSLAFALGRNSGQENVLAFSCKDHGAEVGHVAPTLRAMGHGASHPNAGGQVAVAITQFGDRAGTLTARHDSSPCADRGMNVVSVALRGRDGGATAEIGDDIGNALRASGGGGDKAYALVNSSVRRLTPRECERLQGFPDDYTLIPWRGRVRGLCPDGPRYKAIGNSKAVPVVRWIGMRILEQL